MGEWTVEKSFTFDAAHRLPHVPAGHKCGRTHGHTYTLVVRLSRSSLGDGHDRGMVYEYGQLAKVVKPIVKALDHVTLNGVEGLENPTTEVLAEWVWRKLVGRLPFLSAIVVHESSTTRCEYSA